MNSLWLSSLDSQCKNNNSLTSVFRWWISHEKKHVGPLLEFWWKIHLSPTSVIPCLIPNEKKHVVLTSDSYWNVGMKSVFWRWISESKKHFGPTSLFQYRISDKKYSVAWRWFPNEGFLMKKHVRLMSVSDVWFLMKRTRRCDVGFLTLYFW